ncbi:MAG: sulfate ABC transporter permease subunit CysT [Alphaproteobacteria bacterium PRO2]|nr:sulfate ABC transporter permease subunit CysT [Alphaproteobacteria bacterium PRO2]
MATFALSLKKPGVIPGFGLTMGFTLLYLALIVMIPLAGLVIKTLELSWQEFVATITDPRVVAAFEISFGISFVAALINAVFGLLVAWVLVRYDFPWRKAVDAMVDLPFALPTAVAGIALTAIYAPNGWIGQVFAKFGIEIAFTPTGIAIALVFIGLPFVVRTVEPVLRDLDPEMEEAAVCLGATRLQIFTRIILPQVTPALMAGFAMAFARALGEYGSVIFIAGNMPYKSEIVPLIIVIKLEQYDYAGATAIALVMLIASFIMLLIINLLMKWSHVRRGGGMRA